MGQEIYRMGLEPFAVLESKEGPSPFGASTTFPTPHLSPHTNTQMIGVCQLKEDPVIKDETTWITKSTKYY